MENQKEKEQEVEMTPEQVEKFRKKEMEYLQKNFMEIYNLII